MRATILLSVWLSLALASPAPAYVRTTVDGFPDRPIFWADRAIPVELASSSSSDVAPDLLRVALDRSLATWTRAGSCTDVVLTDVGDALGTTTNLDGGPLDRHNRIVVRESGWPAIVGPETLAITTVLYERTSGAILDADTDVNAVSHAFAASEPPPLDHDDVQNTLTHELGHLLGFGHVSDAQATMFVSAAAGETLKRDLASDDVRAVCETYPIGRPTPTTWPPLDAGASCAAASRSVPLHPALVVAALAALVIRARRGSRRADRADGKACGARRRPAKRA